MTNKIIEAARLAGQYADAEYRRAWEEASDGASWQQNRDARFYALAYRQALEDAANIVQANAQLCGTGGYGHTLLSSNANAILALKEQQHG